MSIHADLERLQRMGLIEDEPRDWKVCFPEIQAYIGDKPIGRECPACGHLIALHSYSRACAACEMLYQVSSLLTPSSDTPNSQ
jgi:hypothetical protein